MEKSMAGLAGIVDSRADKNALENLLERMCKIITHEDWYQTFLYTDDLVGLGRVSLNIFNPEPQPIFNKDRSLGIIMDGEIYNYQDLRRKFALPEDALPIGNDPELLLHLYETYGLDFVGELNGSFASAIWDSTKRKLVIINDRYGLRPIYYTWTHNRLLFASEVKAILQDLTIPRTIDDEAVADFLTFQMILGDKTFFTDIKILSPASIFVYHNGQLSVQRYWDVDFQEDGEGLSEDAYIEHLTFLILQAVERQMQGDYSKGVFLSGGLDSRMLLGAIDRKHYPIHTFTQGTPKCHDVRFGKGIAECVGSRHYYAALEPDFLSAFSERGVWLADGMASCEHQSRLNILSLAREHCQVVFDGLAGGAIPGGVHLAREYFKGDLDDERFVQLVYSRFTKAFSDHSQTLLFSDSYLPKVKGISYESLKKAAESTPAVHFANKSEYIYLKNQQPRFSFFGPIITRSQLECRTPFYDNDVFDFIYTIPPKLRPGKRLLLKLLNKVFPDLAKIPWAFSGIPIVSSTPSRLFIRRGVYKVRRELRSRAYRMTSGRVILPHDGRDYKDYSFWLRTHLRSWAEDILLSRLATSRGYFNTAYIRQILDEHMSGKRNHVSRICTLITLELWHRLFID
jgi:asparagine synthase (glutamine-hydrolysing)